MVRNRFRDVCGRAMESSKDKRLMERLILIGQASLICLRASDGAQNKPCVGASSGLSLAGGQSPWSTRSPGALAGARLRTTSPLPRTWRRSSRLAHRRAPPSKRARRPCPRWMTGRRRAPHGPPAGQRPRFAPPVEASHGRPMRAATTTLSWLPHPRTRPTPHLRSRACLC